MLSTHDYQEESTQKHTEGELRHLQEPMQQHYHPGKHLGGKEPNDNGEPNNLTDDRGNTE